MAAEEQQETQENQEQKHIQRTHYTREELIAELERPQKKAGRPRKYNSPEERARAHREQVCRYYFRKLMPDNPEFATQIIARKTEEERQRARKEQRAEYMRKNAKQWSLHLAARRYREKMNDSQNK